MCHSPGPCRRAAFLTEPATRCRQFHVKNGSRAEFKRRSRAWHSWAGTRQANPASGCSPIGRSSQHIETTSTPKLFAEAFLPPNRMMRHNDSASAEQLPNPVPEQVSALDAVSFSAYSDLLLVDASDSAAGASVALTPGFSPVFAGCASVAALLGSSAVSDGVLSASFFVVFALVAPCRPWQSQILSLARPAGSPCASGASCPGGAPTPR